MDDLVTVHPPIRLVHGPTACYRCGEPFEAAGVVGTVFEEGHETIVMLMYLEELPGGCFARSRSGFLASSVWTRPRPATRTTPTSVRIVEHSPATTTCTSPVKCSCRWMNRPRLP